jgi:hypothetical protein
MRFTNIAARMGWLPAVQRQLATIARSRPEVKDPDAAGLYDLWESHNRATNWPNPSDIDPYSKEVVRPGRQAGLGEQLVVRAMEDGVLTDGERAALTDLSRVEVKDVKRQIPPVRAQIFWGVEGPYDLLSRLEPAERTEVSHLLNVQNPTIQRFIGGHIDGPGLSLKDVKELAEALKAEGTLKSSDSISYFARTTNAGGQPRMWAEADEDARALAAMLGEQNSRSVSPTVTQAYAELRS